MPHTLSENLKRQKRAHADRQLIRPGDQIGFSMAFMDAGRPLSAGTSKGSSMTDAKRGIAQARRAYLDAKSNAYRPECRDGIEVRSGGQSSIADARRAAMAEKANAHRRNR